MAGQAPSRRQLLQALALGSFAGSTGGFCHWAYAFTEPEPESQHAHHATPSSPAKPAAPYRPQFFTAAEYADVILLAELILPRTSPSPGESHAHPATSHATVKPADAGATDAGVAEFIDFMVFHDPTLQAPFRQGLAWINAAGSPQNFGAMPRPDQVTLLERIAFKKNFRPEDKVGQEFFQNMRKYTVMGFYTSRIGLESLDYPGLRFYASSPSVPQDGSLQRLGVRS